MFRKEFYIDNQKLEIKLDLELNTGKAIINMFYLDDRLRQTITCDELNSDLDLLIPKEVGGNDIFGENPIVPLMLSQLKNVLDNHISKYGRLLKSDLGTYVAECILIIDAYMNQLVNKPFESEKKETFQTLYDFFYVQLPEKWKI